MRTTCRPYHLVLVAVLALAALAPAAGAQTEGSCERYVTANVVALDQVFFWNRLGAVQPHGMVYALREDIVPINSSQGIAPGNVMLREDKRPRPITLRMNVGDCIVINFQNLLNPTPVDQEQPATRTASVHVMGMQLVRSIEDDGSWVGVNPSSLASPGQFRSYVLHAEREGTYLMYSGHPVGGEGNNGAISAGLFGALTVEPRGAEWYRSQVSREDMDLATIGFTAQGHPIINYDATYPSTHAYSGKPIFKMLQGNRIVHSDLTAIITGPNRGWFPPGTYNDTQTNPDRNRPFREFTIIFHDEIGAVQAFPQFFDDPVLSHTTHSVRDAFPINYGSGGIGAEIIANRLGVGPMWDCTECKYEEFFLTSWVVGDPAMVVDVPANAPCTHDPSRPSIPDVPPPSPDPCDPTFGPKATKVFYPDDPSNVYHSYLNEHVKFRNLLAGSDDHHIFHLHAHQWVHTPDSDKSAYLDSQAIGQGSGFTYEIAYNGSGNRNQTAGDSIFHCHFYPHFAQGMWAMWRVHDVFEHGTPLTDDGRPKVGTRALPDSEIMAGTPIPGVVPMPTYTMPPMPQNQVSIVQGQVKLANDLFPGYPFYIPGIAGHRPPHPPLDTIDDGGLPRHIITGGEAWHIETRLDFTKELDVAKAFELPETGTAEEKVAMDFHAKRWHSSFLPNGAPGLFKANGRGPVAGAPYADPCIDDFGNPVGGPIDITGNARPSRLYKAADIEMDVVLNKKGWHYPQQRFISLWEDVQDFKFGTKPPEPLFFRANSQECIEFQLTNLVPNIYELDDFQVRTPTDILGQHIHLVKFDVTSSDGSANGYNYEDGTFSPEEVRERIHAINAAGGLETPGGFQQLLTAKDHPFFGSFSPDENGDGIPDWRGAQTTVQRWYADETLDNFGNDRTLRTVFTHDHFGPSTHQQAGLYAGLVVEPKGSQWYHNETGVPLYTRPDGGPTSWQATIETEDAAGSYREFMFEFADFQLAYEPNDKHPKPYNRETGRLAGEGYDDPPNAVNPPGRVEVMDQLPLLYLDPVNAGGCPVHNEPGMPQVPQPPAPCPEAVSADDPGMYSVNYRNEPLAFRLRDPFNVDCLTGPGLNGCQTTGKKGDPSYSYASIPRADSQLNVQPPFYDPLNDDLLGTDPWTPMLRAYEGDNVQIRILVGAHEQEHHFTVHGIKWQYEPSEPNSGWRNSQGMGISEHFELVVPDLPRNAQGSTHDFLYKSGAAVEGQWTGNWGIIRAYRSNRLDVRELPNNPRANGPQAENISDFRGVCPRVAPVRTYEVVAVEAGIALASGQVDYNSRPTPVVNPETGDFHTGPLNDPTAILFVRASDYDFATRKVSPSTPIEPLVLRAAAGDCIEIKLYNELSDAPPDLDGYNAFDNIIDYFNANEIRPSARVGLHPQMLFYDVSRSDGVNVGINPEQTVPPGQAISYQWYAGDVRLNRATNRFEWEPVEFGATNLSSSDPLKHTNKGAIGALVIEPQYSSWVEDPTQRAIATVYHPNANGPTEELLNFRELVTIFQSDVNMRYGDGSPVKPPPDNEDPAERGQKALNYRAEPIWFRMGFQPETSFGTTRTIDFTKVLINDTVGGDPETPLLTAAPGQATRFRVTHPGGHGQMNVFELHGHVWQEEPYTANSSVIGNNPLSEWKGAQPHHGPTNHFDAVLENGAGGKFKVPGDYLYRDYVPWQFFHGTWGIFRVGFTPSPGPDPQPAPGTEPAPGTQF